MFYEVFIANVYLIFAENNYQADLCIEGVDQIRGWFQSSLLLASALNGKAPYR